MSDQSKPEKYSYERGDWGKLPNEPCRFCRAVGGVHFQIDDGRPGTNLQSMRCDKCGRSWTADSTSA